VKSGESKLKTTEIVLDSKASKSDRELIADRIARFININKLNSPFGGDVGLFKGGKVPCYTVAFSVPRVLDGVVNVYSKTFVQVRFNTSYRALPSRTSLVFDSEPNAIKFLKLAFVDLKFDDAMEVPTKAKK